jgi:type III secretion protein C
MSMMKAGMRSRARAAGLLALAGALFHAGGASHAAPPPQWKESGVFAYNASGAPVHKVLGDFAQNFGATLVMAAPPRGVVNGRIQGASPEEFLDRLALSYQFNWFFYNNQLHIAPVSDRITERVRVGDMTPSDVKQALLGVGLFEAKFGWGELQDDGAVLVAGPKEYVKLVREAVSMQLGPAGDETMIFRLRHAFLEDRQINFRDKSIKVPGILTILRNLMRDSRPGGSAISDGGGTSSGPGRSVMQAREEGNAQPALGAEPGGRKGTAQQQQQRAETAAADRKSAGSSKEHNQPVIEGDVRTNSIIVRGDTSKREYYRSLIAQLDMPQQMVEIEALIIDIQKSKIKELGIDWALTFGGGSGRSTVSTNNIAGLAPRDASTLTISNLSRFLSQIRALEGEGSASIVGKPAVMTMENIGAVIDLSRTVYIKLVGERAVDAVPVTVGTLMKVTPKVVRDGGGPPQVQLFIDIEDGSMSEAQSGATPVVERSAVATQMVVDDQQSLVIGGYNLQSSSSGRNGVPGVSRVPLFGAMFRSESEVSQGRERIFIITPRLVDNRKAQTRAKYVAESVEKPQTKMDGALKMDISGFK